jgi:hypothetical protein
MICVSDKKELFLLHGGLDVISENQPIGQITFMRSFRQVIASTRFKRLAAALVNARAALTDNAAMNRSSTQGHQCAAKEF